MLLQPTHCLGQFDQKVRSVLGTRPASAQGNRPRGYRACGPSGAVPGAANVEQDARVRTPDLCPHRIKPRRGWGHCVGAQGSGGDGNLGRLGRVSARSKCITDHAFVPADRRHDLGPKKEPLDFCHPTGPRSAMVRMIPELATVPLRHSGTGCLHPPSPTEGMAEFLGFLVVQRSTLPDTPELATVPDNIGANVDGPGLTLSAPDHSTVSRRAVTLPMIQPAQVPHGPLHVLIDSTGLQVYGADQ